MPPNHNFLHLRRITQNKASLEPGKHDHNLILLDATNKFGRNPDMVDVVLTSAVYSNMISRNHAEIIGKRDSTGRFTKYTISDNSLNGTYINDKRLQISGNVELREGDVIKFGHMNGAAVKPGQSAPQAQAEFAFMVERAINNYSYLGFDANGHRRCPLICRGNADVLQEVAIDDSRKAAAQQAEEAKARAIPTTTTTTTQAGTSMGGTTGLGVAASMAGWAGSAPNFYGGSTQFPFNAAAYSFLANTNQMMMGLGRPGQLQANNPDWAQQLAISQQQLRALNGANTGGLPFGAGGYQPTPSTTASFLSSPIDQRLPNASNQSNLGFNMQQNNAALMSSLLQQQQAHQHQQQSAQQLAAQQQQQHQHAAASVVQQAPPHTNRNMHPPVQQTLNGNRPEMIAPSLSSPAQSVVKPSVASPPMECDSSVPSPPKMTPILIVNHVKPGSPKQATSEDQRSEKSWSMVDSPPPPRAPAPSHANRELSRTPSPKRATPEHEAREREHRREEKEREEKEKEEKEKRLREEKEDKQREENEEREKAQKERQREKEKEKREKSKDREKEKERMERRDSTSSTKGKKQNEVSRLIHDLEGSFMTQASRTEQRKSVDSKENRDKEKEKEHRDKEKEREKKKEKERKEKEHLAKEKEKEKEREREKAKKKEKEKPKEPVKQHRLLKQLSDVSSDSDSSNSDSEKPKKKRSNLAPPPIKKKEFVKKVEIVKKEAVKRRPSPPPSSTSSSDSDSDVDSMEGGKRKHTKKTKKGKKEKEVVKEKNSEKTSLLGKKRGRKAKNARSSSSSDDEPNTSIPTQTSETVVFHDPVEACGMAKECNRPQNDNVNWVQCDECDTWYHTICILGKEEGPADEERFNCGCTDKKKKKKKMRT